MNFQLFRLWKTGKRRPRRNDTSVVHASCKVGALEMHVGCFRGCDHA